MIRMVWHLEGIGKGSADVTTLDAVSVIVGAIVKGYAFGPTGRLLPALLSPVTNLLMTDIRRALSDEGRWEYEADGFRVVVVDDASDLS